VSRHGWEWLVYLLSLHLRLLLRLLLGGMCRPGGEDGRLLRARNDGSSPSPTHRTTRPTRPILTAPPTVIAIQRSAAVVAACTRSAFTWEIPLLLSLVR